MQIHEYYDEVDKARALIESYRKDNPLNPNAHRILYEFETKHRSRDQSVKLSCLKVEANIPFSIFKNISYIGWALQKTAPNLWLYDFWTTHWIPLK